MDAREVTPALAGFSGLLAAQSSKLVLGQAKTRATDYTGHGDHLSEIRSWPISAISPRRPAFTKAQQRAEVELRKTAINDAIRNGATMHEVREFAGHADIRTTEVYFVRREEDAEVAARRIQIRLTGRKSD
ncbi:MAG: site-specific integrase [Acetobacteraceae bacterium]|nr:site-specific integrase [Acetobacteraceae bacterium]